MSRSILAVVACLAAFASACGGDEEPNASAESTPAATQAAQAANLDAIKTYLLEHTDRLVTSTEQLQSDTQAYSDLAKAEDFDYAALLDSKREAVQAAV